LKFKTVITAVLTLVLSAACLAQDVTFQHVVGSNPNSAELRIRIKSARRVYQPIVARAFVKPPVIADWNVSIGALGVSARGQGDYTAQWNDSMQGLSTPSCTADYSIVPINVTPSATQANIVLFNQLYRGPSPGGICGTGTPATLAAYQLGTTGTLGSPTLAVNGTKFAILERGNATLHIVTIGTGGGTVTAPILPGASDVSLDYTNLVTANCTAGTVHHANSSDVWVDYGRDEAYVGDDAGRIYLITGAFKGTPTLSFCTQVGSGGSAKIGLPEHINVSGTDYVYFINNGQTIRRTQVNATRTGFTSNITRTLSSVTGRIVDGSIIDTDGGFIYVWTNNDATGASAALYQLNLGLVIQAELNIGPVTTQPYYNGYFDNNYFVNGASGTNATMYTCGYPNGTGNAPKLYSVQFNGTTGVMNTAFFLAGDGNIANATLATGNTCAPMVSTFDSVTGVDQLFVGTGNGTTTNNSKLSRWDITTPFSLITTTPTNSVTGVPGGTGGLLIDWEPSNLGAETQNIYFVNVATPTAARCGGASAPFPSCETKLQQAGLNN
jgi:hypothetical protein